MTTFYDKSIRVSDPRSGYYRKNGKGETSYQSFVPSPLQDIELIVDDGMKRLADAALLHIREKDKEGIDRSDDEVESSVALAWNIPSLMLMPTENKDTHTMVADRRHLRKALDYGIGHLPALPLSGRLMKDLHWIAMQGEHNEKTYPREFRTSPIWIGSDEDTLSTAPFVPPSPEDMLKAFYDLEQYIHSEDNIHPLIKAALIHCQFEVIHPFIDGNGRMGRMLVLLYLMDCGILSGCTVHLSQALHIRRFQYDAGIASVEISGAYEKWVRFFVNALLQV